MILKFPVYLQDGTPALSKVYGLKITVDGTVVLNSADASAESYPLAPVVTTNGLSVVMNTDANNIKAEIAGLRVWESTSVTLEITKTAYNTYTNTFKVFGYDLGNSAGSNNPDFNIYLIETAWGAANAYANLIAYREPFTKRIHYYNATSGTVTMTSTGFSMGANGFICSYEDTDITATQGASSTTLSVLKKMWMPDFNLSVDCPNCTDECISTVDTPTAQVDIDFAAWNAPISTSVFVDGVQQYSFKNLSIEYKLIKYDGTLVDSKKFGLPLVYPNTTFDPAVYAWSTFTIPAAGDYVIQACIIAEEVLGSEISNGSTVVGTWYRITDTSGAADFTTIGAPTGFVDEEFIATGDTPTWGTGALKVISAAYTCCKSQALKGCERYEIEKTEDCTIYNVVNNTFDIVDVNVKVMTSLGVLENVVSIPIFSIAARGTTAITLPEDGVYTVLIYPTGNSASTDARTYIIHNYCNLENCFLTLLNSSICSCTEVTECENLCKKFYMFNAMSVLSLTYFGLVNSEYEYNYIYTAIDSDKIKELFTTKTVLDKLGNYCECITGDSSSSGAGGCGCS